MKELESLKKTILEQYPRLKEDAEFNFACHPGVSCFNQCCSDVNIFLTPYDVLRLKNHAMYRFKSRWVGLKIVFFTRADDGVIDSV